MIQARVVLIRFTCRLGLAVLILAATVGTAGAQTPAFGEYSTKRGWGTLEVMQSGDKTSFSILAIGGNEHFCELDGEVRDGLGLLADSDAVLKNGGSSLNEDDSERCIIIFKYHGSRVDVRGKSDSCRNECPSLSGFEAVYYRLPNGCNLSYRQAARANSKRLYDEKRLTDAQALLKRLFRCCGRFLQREEDGWLRNDLALIQHRLGNNAACRRTLVPLTSEAGQSDEQVVKYMPPLDGEEWLPVIRAARTNLTLCGTDVRR